MLTVIIQEKRMREAEPMLNPTLDRKRKIKMIKLKQKVKKKSQHQKLAYTCTQVIKRIVQQRKGKHFI